MSDTVLKVREMRISVALGAALMIQTALALIWSGAAAERLSQLERQSDATQDLVVVTARLEEQVYAIRTQLSRIESALDDGDRP